MTRMLWCANCARNWDLADQGGHSLNVWEWLVLHACRTMRTEAYRIAESRRGLPMAVGA